MKVIIAGSRDIHLMRYVEDAIQMSGFTISEVVDGCADGVDLLGEAWAIDNGIPIKKFPANWGKFGKAAGPIRNREMAEYADALIAVWDGKSKGTQDMIRKAQKRGLKICVHLIKESPRRQG